jgi:hypothetical protein
MLGHGWFPVCRDPARQNARNLKVFLAFLASGPAEVENARKGDLW